MGRFDDAYNEVMSEGRLASFALGAALLGSGVSAGAVQDPTPIVQSAQASFGDAIAFVSNGDRQLMTMLAKTVCSRSKRFGCSIDDAMNDIPAFDSVKASSAKSSMMSSEIAKKKPVWNGDPSMVPVSVIRKGETIPSGYSKSTEYGGFVFLRFTGLTEKEDYVARTIYSETSSTCTDEEVSLVCDVINNRIGNRAFGNGHNAYDVCSAKNAFSATAEGRHNAPWNDYGRGYVDKHVKDCQEKAKMLMSGLWTPSNKNIVYYHDKSISTPKSWTNKYWTPVLEKSTTNFKFFSIMAAGKTK